MSFLTEETIAKIASSKGFVQTIGFSYNTALRSFSGATTYTAELLTGVQLQSLYDYVAIFHVQVGHDTNGEDLFAQYYRGASFLEENHLGNLWDGTYSYKRSNTVVHRVSGNGTYDFSIKVRGGSGNFGNTQIYRTLIWVVRVA